MADTRAATCTWPIIKCFADISAKSDEIQAFARDHPMLDRVYTIETSERGAGAGGSDATDAAASTCASVSTSTIAPSGVVAGSTALRLAIQYYVGTRGSEAVGKWQPEDTDVFFFSRAKPARRKMGHVDLVDVKETNVEQLLLSFDLPCCRIATDTTHRWWVSLQCINAMLAHTYTLPEYMHEKKSFVQQFISTVCAQRASSSQAQAQVASTPLFVPSEGEQSITNEYASLFYERLQERIRKYESRGFRVCWIDTPIVVPWMAGGCMYAEEAVRRHRRDQE